MTLFAAAGSVVTAVLASNALGWNPLSSSTTEALMLVVWGATLLAVGRRVQVRNRVAVAAPVKHVAPRLAPSSAGLQARA